MPAARECPLCCGFGFAGKLVELEGLRGEQGERLSERWVGPELMILASPCEDRGFQKGKLEGQGGFEQRSYMT